MNNNVAAEKIKIKAAQIEYHLCTDTSGQKQSLKELINDQTDTWLIVKILYKGRVLQQFGIPPRGSRYCRFCSGEFLNAPPMVSCTDDTATVRDGLVGFEMNDRITKYLKEDEDYPILKSESDALHKDGRIWHNGRRYLSATGQPVVFVRDDIYIDSEGVITYTEPERFAPPAYRRYINGTLNGRLCITSDRKLLFDQAIFSVDGEPVIDVCHSGASFLALTANGNVYERHDHPDWDPYDDDWDIKIRDIWVRVPIGEKVHAFSAGGRMIAIASEHTVYLYQCSDKTPGITLHKMISRDNEYVSEVAVSNKKLVLQYLSGNWEVLNWQDETVWNCKSNHDINWLWNEYAKREKDRR